QYAEVPPERKQLQEVLHEHGYGTAAAYGHPIAGKAIELTRGMEQSREIDDAISSAQITDQLIEYADGISRSGRPFFLYGHYYDPHWNYEQQPPEFTPWEGTARVDLYDGELRFVDFHIARLTHALEEKGLLQKTVLVVASDHGEEFGEHGGEFHGKSM